MTVTVTPGNARAGGVPDDAGQLSDWLRRRHHSAERHQAYDSDNAVQCSAQWGLAVHSRPAILRPAGAQPTNIVSLSRHGNFAADEQQNQSAIRAVFRKAPER